MTRRTVSRAHVSATVQALYPSPCEVTVGGRRTEGDATYLVVPSLDRARLLAPAEPRRALAGSIQQFLSPTSAKRRALATALTLGLRRGGGMLFPHRVGVRVPSEVEDPSFPAWVGRPFGQRVHCALYLGPPRAVQKPVALILDDDGSSIGFAKVGTTEVSRRLVEQETRVLRHLAEHEFATLTVPDIVHADTWQGHPVLVQRVIRRHGRTSVTESMRTAAVAEVVHTGSVRSSVLSESRYLHQLTTRVDSLPEPWRTQLNRSLEVVRPSPAQVTFGGSHGDWTPWNMTTTPEARRLGVWDWEHYREQVPVAFDALHHEMATGLVVRGLAVTDAAARLSDRAPEIVRAVAAAGGFPEHEQLGHLVCLLYLIDIGCRYLEDGEQHAGSRAGRVDDWLDEALKRQERLVTTSSPTTR